MTTWVLLRGLMREARHWGDFPALFARHMQAGQDEKITVLTPDFAGNGTRCHERSATRVAQMGERLSARLREDGHAPPYKVLALSLGAMAGVAWAYSRPEELACLVLMNTSLQPFSPFHQRLRPENYPDLLGLLFADVAKREQTILQITANLADAAQKASLVQSWQSYARERPVSRSNMLRQLWAAMRFRAQMQPPAVPLLMLASEHDRLVNVECSRKIAAQWQCPLRLHPGAGHDLTLDDGAWVMREISAWLAAR